MTIFQIKSFAAGLPGKCSLSSTRPAYFLAHSRTPRNKFVVSTVPPVPGNGFEATQVGVRPSFYRERKAGVQRLKRNLASQNLVP